MNKRVICVIVLALLSTTTSPGSVGLADSSQVPDPDDTDGSLDIAEASYRHDESAYGGSILVHRLRTYESWETQTLDGENSFVSLEIYVDSRRGVDVALEIFPNSDGSLYGEVVRYYRNSTHKFLSYARVWRPDQNSISVLFPRKYLGSNIDSYRWAFVTIYSDPSDENCRGVQGDVVQLCEDFVAGRHRL